MHHSFHENRNCLTCYSEVSNFLIVFSNCSLQVNGAFWISCKDCLPGDRELHNIGGAYFATFHKRSYCLNSYTLMSCANKWPRCSSEHAFYRLSGGRAGVAVCTFFPSTSQNSSLFLWHSECRHMAVCVSSSHLEACHAKWTVAHELTSGESIKVWGKCLHRHLYAKPEHFLWLWTI